MSSSLSSRETALLADLDTVLQSGVRACSFSDIPTSNLSKDITELFETASSATACLDLTYIAGGLSADVLAQAAALQPPAAVLCAIFNVQLRAVCVICADGVSDVDPAAGDALRALGELLREAGDVIPAPHQAKLQADAQAVMQLAEAVDELVATLTFTRDHMAASKISLPIKMFVTELLLPAPPTPPRPASTAAAAAVRAAVAAAAPAVQHRASSLASDELQASVLQTPELFVEGGLLGDLGRDVFPDLCKRLLAAAEHDTGISSMVCSCRQLRALSTATKGANAAVRSALGKADRALTGAVAAVVAAEAAAVDSLKVERVGEKVVVVGIEPLMKRVRDARAVLACLNKEKVIRTMISTYILENSSRIHPHRLVATNAVGVAREIETMLTHAVRLNTDLLHKMHELSNTLNLWNDRDELVSPELRPIVQMAEQRIGALVDSIVGAGNGDAFTMAGDAIRRLRSARSDLTLIADQCREIQQTWMTALATAVESGSFLPEAPVGAGIHAWKEARTSLEAAAEAAGKLAAERRLSRPEGVAHIGAGFAGELRLLWLSQLAKAASDRFKAELPALARAWAADHHHLLKLSATSSGWSLRPSAADHEAAFEDYVVALCGRLFKAVNMDSQDAHAVVVHGERVLFARKDHLVAVNNNAWASVSLQALPRGGRYLSQWAGAALAAADGKLVFCQSETQVRQTPSVLLSSFIVPFCAKAATTDIERLDLLPKLLTEHVPLVFDNAGYSNVLTAAEASIARVRTLTTTVPDAWVLSHGVPTLVNLAANGTFIDKNNDAHDLASVQFTPCPDLYSQMGGSHVLLDTGVTKLTGLTYRTSDGKDAKVAPDAASQWRLVCKHWKTLLTVMMTLSTRISSTNVSKIASARQLAGKIRVENSLAIMETEMQSQIDIASADSAFAVLVRQSPSLVDALSSLTKALVDYVASLTSATRSLGIVAGAATSLGNEFDSNILEVLSRWRAFVAATIDRADVVSEVANAAIALLHRVHAAASTFADVPAVSGSYDATGTSIKYVLSQIRRYETDYQTAKSAATSSLDKCAQSLRSSLQSGLSKSSPFMQRLQAVVDTSHTLFSPPKSVELVVSTNPDDASRVITLDCMPSLEAAFASVGADIARIYSHIHSLNRELPTLFAGEQVPKSVTELLPAGSWAEFERAVAIILPYAAITQTLNAAFTLLSSSTPNTWPGSRATLLKCVRSGIKFGQNLSEMFSGQIAGLSESGLVIFAKTDGKMVTYASEAPSITNDVFVKTSSKPTPEVQVFATACGSTLRGLSFIEDHYQLVSGDGFFPHHWETFATAIGAALPLSLLDILAAAPRLPRLQPQLLEMAASARAERTVYETVTSIEQWLCAGSVVPLVAVPLSVPITRHDLASLLGSQASSYLPESVDSPDTESYRVTSWTAVMATAADSHDTLEAAADAPAAARYTARINAARAAVDDVACIARVLSTIQNDWGRLEPILGRGIVAVEIGRFHRVSQFCVTCMRALRASGGVIGALAQITPPASMLASFGWTAATSMRQAITTMAQELEIVVAAVKSFLGTKRDTFPRFMFLGDDDLLSLLAAAAAAPRGVEPFLPKLFPAIARLVPDASAPSPTAPRVSIVAVASAEGEVVSLDKPVLAAADVPPENWLAELETALARSMRRLVDMSVKIFSERAGTLPPLIWLPCQAVIAGLAVWASDTVESVIRTGGTSFAEMSATLNKIIEHCTRMRRPTASSDACKSAMQVFISGNKQLYTVSDSNRVTINSSNVVNAVAAVGPLATPSLTLALATMSGMPLPDVPSGDRATGILVDASGKVYTPVDYVSNDLMQKRATSIATEVMRWQRVITLLAQESDEPITARWYRELRYSNMPNGLQLKCFDGSINYGYEYIGVPPRIVHTALTSVAYGVLITAASLGMGGALAGPAGTGKTETVKALATSAGRQILVFNCDSSMRAGAVARILAGAARTGAWAGFDEMNRLTSEALSATADALSELQTAIATKRADPTSKYVLSLGGCETSTYSTDTLAFFTMNPAMRGYGGRVQIPSSLDRLFRPVTMSTPDTADIVVVSLSVSGFQNADVLAKKLVHAFSQIGRQVSAQQHYDFSLRAIKAVLQAISVFQNAVPGRSAPSPRLVARGIVASLAPKLTPADLNVARRVVRTVFESEGSFSDDELSADLDATFVGAADRAIAGQSGVTVHSNLPKVQELLEALQQRSGAVVIGPPQSGKSTIIEGYIAALRETAGLGDDHLKVERLAPSALDKAGLLGELNVTTQTYSDGVLVARARAVAAGVSSDIAAGVYTRYVFWLDGCVEPEWIEALNSVLDDNARLTLPTGEVFALPKDRVSFIFETDSLAAASPATISRLGVVFTLSNTPTLTSKDINISAIVRALNCSDETTAFTTKVVEALAKSECLHNRPLRPLALAIQNAHETASPTQAGTVAAACTAVHIAMQHASLPISQRESALTQMTSAVFSAMSLTPAAVWPVPTQLGTTQSAPSALPVGKYILSQQLLSVAVALRPAILSQQMSLTLLTGTRGSGRASVAQAACQLASCQDGPVAVASQTGAVNTVITRVSCNAYTTHTDIFSALRTALPSRGFDRSGMPMWSPASGTRAVLLITDVDALHGADDRCLPALELVRAVVETCIVPDLSSADRQLVRLAGLAIILTSSDGSVPSRLAAHAVTIQVPSAEQDTSLVNAIASSALSNAASTATNTDETEIQLLKRLSQVPDLAKRVMASASAMAVNSGSRLGVAAEIFSVLASARISSTAQPMPAAATLIRTLAYTTCPAQAEAVASAWDPSPANLVPVPCGSVIHMSPVSDLLNLHAAAMRDHFAGQPTVPAERALLAAAGVATLLANQMVIPAFTAPVSGVAEVVCVAMQLMAGGQQAHLWQPSSTGTREIGQELRDMLAMIAANSSTVMVHLSSDLVAAEPAWLAFAAVATAGAAAVMSYAQQTMTNADWSSVMEAAGPDTSYEALTETVASKLRICVELDSDNLQHWPSLSAVSALDLRGLGVFAGSASTVMSDTSLDALLGNDREVKTLLIAATNALISSHCIDPSPTVPLCAARVYSHISREQVAADKERRAHLDSGLDALSIAHKAVSGLQAEAAEAEATLQVTVAEATATMERISESLTAAAQRRSEADLLKVDLEREQAIVAEQAARADAQLAEVLPILESAKAGVRSIDSAALAEMKSMRTPPPMVFLVKQAVTTLLGAFDVAAIAKFDPKTVSEKTLRTVEQMAAKFVDVERSSRAAAPLALWVQAVLKVGDAAKVVAPLEAARAAAMRRSEEAAARLATIDDEIKALDESVASMKIEHEEMSARAKQLTEDLGHIQTKLSAAQRLTNSLGTEQTRWQAESNLLAEKAAAQVPWLLLQSLYAAAAVRASEDKRTAILQTIIPVLFKKTPELLASKSFSFADLAVRAVSRALWSRNGLPQSPLAHDNASAFTIASACPLRVIIDPAGTITRWLTAQLGSAVEVTSSSGRLRTAISNAATFGQRLIVTLDVTPFPAALAAIVCATATGMKAVRISGREIVIHESFELVVVASSASTVMSSSTLAGGFVADFALTRDSIAQVIAGAALRTIRGDLAVKAERAVEREAEMHADALVAEQKLLDTLALAVKSDSSILENVTLAGVLDETAAKAKQRAEAGAAVAKVQQAAAAYTDNLMPIALLAADAFTVCSAFDRFSSTYTINLASFTDVVCNAMMAAKQQSENQSESESQPGSRPASASRSGLTRALLAAHVDRAIVRFVLTGLPQRHHLPALLALAHALRPRMLTPPEWKIVLGTATSPSTSFPVPAWARAAEQLIAVMPPGAQTVVAANPNEWATWAGGETPETSLPAAASVPEFTQSPWRVAALVAAVRPDRALAAATVAAQATFRAAAPFTLAQVFNGASGLPVTATRPALVVCPRGVDALSGVISTLTASGVARNTIQVVSAGESAAENVSALLASETPPAHLVFVNAHLARSVLEKVIFPSLQNSTNGPVITIITEDVADGVPAAAAAACARIFVEAPVTAAAAARAVTSTEFITPKVNSRDGLVLRVALLTLYAHITGRCALVPRGWSTQLPFTPADIQTAATLADTAALAAGGRYDLAKVRTLVMHAVLAPRTDHMSDRLALQTLVNGIIHDQLLAGGASPLLRHVAGVSPKLSSPQHVLQIAERMQSLAPSSLQLYPAAARAVQSEVAADARIITRALLATTTATTAAISSWTSQPLPPPAPAQSSDPLTTVVLNDRHQQERLLKIALATAPSRVVGGAVPAAWVGPWLTAPVALLGEGPAAWSPTEYVAQLARRIRSLDSAVVGRMKSLPLADMIGAGVALTVLEFFAPKGCGLAIGAVPATGATAQYAVGNVGTTGFNLSANLPATSSDVIVQSAVLSVVSLPINALSLELCSNKLRHGILGRLAVVDENGAILLSDKSLKPDVMSAFLYLAP